MVLQVRCPPLRCLVRAVLCSWWVIDGSATARAEPASAEQAEVRSRALFDAALAARGAGELRRALCLMQSAQADAPHNAFLFNIAQLQRDLGLCTRARAGYLTYLARESDAELRRVAQAALAALQACVPAVESTTASDALECTHWTQAALAPPALETTPEAPASDLEAEPVAHLQDKPAPDTTVSSGAAPTLVQSAPITVAQAPAAAHVASDSADSVLSTLSWIMLGTAVVLGGATVYEASELSSAQRAIERATSWDTRLAGRATRGERAEALSWVFGTSCVLMLTGALVTHWLARPVDHSSPLQPRSTAF